MSTPPRDPGGGFAFRTRLVVVVTTLTIVTLGGAFFGVYWVVRREEERRFDRGLIADAEGEAAHLAELDVPTFKDRPRVGVGELGPLARWAVLYDARGEIVLATDNWQGRAPPRASLRAGPGQPFDLALPRPSPEHLRGLVLDVARPPGARVFTAVSRRELDGDVVLLARAMGIVFAVASAWSVLVASWMLRRLTRGHVAIAEVARRVTAGDLKARVGTVATDRETAALARNVDSILDRLAELLDAQGRFVAHAAHELRSPITVLYGELALALRRPRDADGYREAIAKAHASTRDLRALAEDLLELARLGAEDPGPPTDEAADARAVLEEATAAHLARGDVRVVVSAPEDLRVRGPSRDLGRMVRNLVDNAVRHSPGGGLVRVEARRDGDAAVVAVIDEGPGIREVDRERIFEPFLRGARERAASGGGAGLGLAIARGIARANGGTLRCGPRDDGRSGALFEARLPTARGNAEETPDVPRSPA